MKRSASAEEQLRQWFMTRAGRALAGMEVAIMERALTGLRGHQFVEVGDVLPNMPDLELTRIRHQLHMSTAQGSGALIGDTEALPLQSDSVDVLLMPHALDLADDPHQVLREAHRVLAPEGYLVMSGFNPWSVAGLVKLMRRRREMPWSSRWLAPGRVRDWLALLGFQPRSASSPWMQSMADRMGIDAKRVPHLLGGQPLHALASGVYVLVARKHVVWIRPVVSRWRRRPRLSVVGLAEPAARAQRDAQISE